MKYLARFLLAVLCVVPFGAQGSNVPTTRGNNLTAYNGASGSTNNNNWNALMNVRSGSDAADMPVADFGNCNAIVLRCAQPKCANGGCTDMNIAATIVNGCVQSNEACKEYGDDLIGYIAAQLVANSTAKANAAQNAAAQAAAEQNAQQMQQMQAQMQQQMQQMAAQNAETVAQLQSALDEQKQMTAQAIADATASRSAPVATTTTSSSSNNDLTTQQQAAAGALTTAQQIAAQNGVSPDILAREQITGQIMSSLENAETQLKTLKTTMADTFEYAGCDTKGSNCTGPKRVKVFKQKAMSFFDPYENVLDELYDALITAQAVGVDITDIYMMLNGSCNVWGKYLCNLGATIKERVCDEPIVTVVGTGISVTCKDNLYHYETRVKNTDTYDDTSCPNNTRSVQSGRARGGHECIQGQVIPPEDDIACTLQKMIVDSDDDPVQRDWLWNETDEEGSNIRVGCASSALEASKFFRNRKKGTNLDIEILERIVEQDAPSSFGAIWGNSNNTTSPKPDGVKYCAVSGDTIGELEKIVSLKTLPKPVCVKDGSLEQIFNDDNGKVTTSNGMDCENDDNNRINPLIALCSTHVYNIGEAQNQSDESRKQQMRQVIALKTTFMTQQMYKQYEYMETMIRRFKTQLEKAVLTTKLQAASGGNTSGSSSSSTGGSVSGGSVQRSRDVYAVVDGAQDCNLIETGTADALQCVQGNITAALRALDEGKNAEARRQLQKDLEVAKRYGRSYNDDLKNNKVTSCNTIASSSNPSTLRTCAYDLRSAVALAITKYNNESSRTRATP
ncbi:MAG: hypothetical protein J6Y49_00895 [Alphaproteobacteria bacterium]|nr:hypothetical protein [Alphaproteobacteria bacterium]